MRARRRCSTRSQSTASRVCANPLSWRAEGRRQWGRRRTTGAFGLLLALPLVLVSSFAFGERSTQQPRWRDDADLRPRAERGGELQPRARLPRLRAAARALAALFCGDAVPSRGVVGVAALPAHRAGAACPPAHEQARRRHRLDRARHRPAACVGALVGGLAYGWEPLTNPLGENLTWGQFLPRLALAMRLHLRDAAADRGHRLLARDPLRRSARGGRRGGAHQHPRSTSSTSSTRSTPTATRFPGHYNRGRGRTPWR